MRFKDSFEIEFPQNQVTLITGENAAGKTSVLDALCVCLYGRTFRTSGRTTSGFLGINDLINHESNKASIRVEFENHNHNYVVTREITENDSEGELFEDGERKAIGKHVYAYVGNRAIGLDWEGFRKSSVVLQGEMSALTDLDPGPRKKAFMQLFGLDTYSLYEQLAKKKAERKESDIYATEEANKILWADVEAIPDVKDEIKQLHKSVKGLEGKKERLGKVVNTRRRDVDALESGHNDYIKQSQKLDGISKQIGDAKEAVEKDRNELDRLLSVQRHFGVLERSYIESSSLERKLSDIQPAKLEYDELAKEYDRESIARHGKEDTLSDIVGQIRETKSITSELRKQIPTASELAKVKKELKDAREVEREVRARSNSLRGQTKQIGYSIDELREKREQVKGKDKCPVCFQRITNPQHIMKHYNDQISELECKRSVLEKERISILRELKTIPKKVKRLENLERELEKGVSKAEQVRRETKRLESLEFKKNSLVEEIGKIKKNVGSLDRKRDNLNFDSAKYRRLDERVRKFRRNKVVERYTNAKTELERLPEARDELGSAQNRLGGLLNDEKTTQKELKRLTEVEVKYVKARQLFEKAQKEFNDNNSVLATESEKERQARTRLGDLREKERKLEANLKQIRRLGQERTTLEELRDIFKNIPQNILRRLRPYIEQEGTDIINDLSDNELTALNIEEETLNVAATTNGEIRPIHYFSGGQKTRINMALRVAISRILSKMPQTEEHTFAIMQTLFIDEGDFGNLDEGGTRDAVNVIRNLTKEFDRVILISHVDIIREIFHGYTVEVRKRGLEESVIRISGGEVEHGKQELVA